MPTPVRHSVDLAQAPLRPTSARPPRPGGAPSPRGRNSTPTRATYGSIHYERALSPRRAVPDPGATPPPTPPRLRRIGTMDSASPHAPTPPPSVHQGQAPQTRPRTPRSARAATLSERRSRSGSQQRRERHDAQRHSAPAQPPPPPPDAALQSGRSEPPAALSATGGRSSRAGASVSPQTSHFRTASGGDAPPPPPPPPPLHTVPSAPASQPPAAPAQGGSEYSATLALLGAARRQVTDWVQHHSAAQQCVPHQGPGAAQPAGEGAAHRDPAAPPPAPGDSAGPAAARGSSPVAPDAGGELAQLRTLLHRVEGHLSASGASAPPAATATEPAAAAALRICISAIERQQRQHDAERAEWQQRTNRVEDRLQRSDDRLSSVSARLEQALAAVEAQQRIAGAVVPADGRALEERARAFEERVMQGNATVARNVERMEALFSMLYKAVSELAAPQRGPSSSDEAERRRQESEQTLRQQLRSCLALHVDNLDAELGSVLGGLSGVEQRIAELEAHMQQGKRGEWCAEREERLRRGQEETQLRCLKQEEAIADIQAAFERYVRDGTAYIVRNEGERRGELREELLLLLSQLQDQLFAQLDQLQQWQGRESATWAQRSSSQDAALRETVAAAEGRMQQQLNQAVGSMREAAAGARESAAAGRDELQQLDRRIIDAAEDAEGRVRELEALTEAAQVRLAAAQRADISALRSSFGNDLAALVSRMAVLEERARTQQQQQQPQRGDGGRNSVVGSVMLHDMCRDLEQKVGRLGREVEDLRSRPAECSEDDLNALRSDLAQLRAEQRRGQHAAAPAPGLSAQEVRSLVDDALRQGDQRRQQEVRAQVEDALRQAEQRRQQEMQLAVDEAGRQSEQRLQQAVAELRRELQAATSSTGGGADAGEVAELRRQLQQQQQGLDEVRAALQQVRSASAGAAAAPAPAPGGTVTDSELSQLRQELQRGQQELETRLQQLGSRVDQLAEEGVGDGGGGGGGGGEGDEELEGEVRALTKKIEEVSRRVSALEGWKPEKDKESEQMLKQGDRMRSIEGDLQDLKDKIAELSIQK